RRGLTGLRGRIAGDGLAGRGKQERRRLDSAGAVRHAAATTTAAFLQDMTGTTAASPLRHLYLVDGSGYIFRAYHALPPLTRADGTPVNAVLGFTNMLMKLISETDAD